MHRVRAYRLAVRSTIKNHQFSTFIYEHIQSPHLSLYPVSTGSQSINECHPNLQGYKVLSTQQPAYLYNLISYHQSSRLLARSSSQSLLHVPKIKTDFGRRAFSSATPQIGNHIPTAIRVSPSLDSFKRHLKTHYFASP